MDLFGLDKTSKHPEGLELLTTVFDNVELAVVRSILEGAGIPYLIKERGSGSSVKIITGLSIFGTDIFVRSEEFETATDLITPIDQGEDAPDEEAEQEGEI